MQLTVGAVSGLIAIAIAILQLLVPNALTVVLVSILSPEQNAFTWSAVSHSLSNSIWPRLLRSDMADSEGVPTKINLVTWTKPISLALIAVAAVITPIGLYEDLVLSKSPRLVTFEAVDDTGTIGSGTPPRSDLGFSRGCGGSITLLQCPGTYTVINTTTAGGFINTTIESNMPYDRRVPKLLAELYQSGLREYSGSVSSYFDIQSRQYRFGSGPTNDTYLVDSFQSMGSLIMDNYIVLVYGLIVDMGKGAIGFRKHTVPAGLQYGPEWDEDILFLKPETVCVDINLAYEVQVPSVDALHNGSAPAAYLVDQGGWARMNLTNTFLDSWFENLQTSLLSPGRSKPAGSSLPSRLVDHVLNMYYFNISKPYTNRTAYLDSHVGRRFPVNTTTFTVTSKDQLLFSNFYHVFDGIPNGYLMANGTLNVAPPDNYLGPPYWSNPWNINTWNYTDIGTTCSGAFGGDKANMTNLDLRCGVLLGPSRRVDGTESNVYAPGSWWTWPIYTCASTTKASIKSVHFNYNSSIGSGLSGLNATRITDKIYQNKSSMPLWGVETANMNTSDITPFWGLISSD